TSAMESALCGSPDNWFAAFQFSPKGQGKVPWLPVDFSEHAVYRPDARDHVGNQLPFDELGQRLQIDERRGAEMHAKRLGRTVAGHEAAQLAARRLHGNKRLAGLRRKSLSENFEVVDERFHLRLHFFALRRDDS